MNDGSDHITYHVAQSKLAIRYNHQCGYACKILYYIINASGQTSVGHTKIPSNKRAHRLAKLASGPSFVVYSYQRI